MSQQNLTPFVNPKKTIKREVPALISLAEGRKLLVKPVTLFSTIFFLYSVRVIHDCCQVHPCLAFLLYLDNYYLLNLYAYILITKVICYNLLQIVTSKYQKKEILNIVQLLSIKKKNARTHTLAQRKPFKNYYRIYTAFWSLQLTPTIKA